MNEIQNENRLNLDDSHSTIVHKLHLIYWYSMPEMVVNSDDLDVSLEIPSHQTDKLAVWVTTGEDLKSQRYLTDRGFDFVCSVRVAEKCAHTDSTFSAKDFF
jgi:hypothetical protein